MTVRTYDTANSGSTPLRTVRDDRECAGRSDGRDRGIAHRPTVGGVVDRALEVREAPRSSASLREAALASASMKPMTFSPRATASSES